MAFQISTQEKGETLVVSLSGSLDTLFAEDLKTAFGQVLRTGKRHVVLDLQGVKYVASSAIRAFLYLAKSLQKTRGELRVAQVNPKVLEVFKMVGMGSAIPIFDSLPEAMEGFGDPGRVEEYACAERGMVPERHAPAQPTRLAGADHELRQPGG
jgi:anti-anti-sigma factor